MEELNKNNNLHETMHLKNMIITMQNRRIKRLEDKLDEVRHRYFNLKKYVSLKGSTNDYGE